MSPLLRFGREIGQVIWKYFKLISRGGEKKGEWVKNQMYFISYMNK